MYSAPIRPYGDANSGAVLQSKYPLKARTLSTNCSLGTTLSEISEYSIPLASSRGQRTEPLGPPQKHLSYSMQRWVNDTEGDRVVAATSISPSSSTFVKHHSHLEGLASRIGGEMASRLDRAYSSSLETIAGGNAFSTDDIALNYLGAWVDNEAIRECREKKLPDGGLQQVAQFVPEVRSVLDDFECVFAKLKDVVHGIEGVDQWKYHEQ